MIDRLAQIGQRNNNQRGGTQRNAVAAAPY
jgi:hypothetical protein